MKVLYGSWDKQRVTKKVTKKLRNRKAPDEDLISDLTIKFEFLFLLHVFMNLFPLSHSVWAPPDLFTIIIIYNQLLINYNPCF